MSSDSELPEAELTCPQYFLRLPAVAQVYYELGDYRRGALGKVGDLPAAFLAYLRTADEAQHEWQLVQDQQLAEQRKKLKPS